MPPESPFTLLSLTQSLKYLLTLYKFQVEIRDKTSLHIACAHDRSDIVEMLLSYDADVTARSDGGWTPLHNAAEKGSKKIVRILLDAGSEINAMLLTGMTPLHLASQGGHYDVVKCLLERKDIKRAARDSFGSTPFLRAAQNKRKDIVDLLSPVNNIKGLSEDALGACNGFNATIVDFGNFHNENRVRKRTLYGKSRPSCFHYVTALILLQNYFTLVILSTRENPPSAFCRTTTQQILDGFICLRTTWHGSRRSLRSPSLKKELVMWKVLKP